jgi:hypothetical protein
MGLLIQSLDTKAELFQGTYGSFNLLQDMVLQFHTEIDRKTVKEMTEEKRKALRDATIKANPKLPALVNHSDCEGGWTVDECKQVLESIKKVEHLFPEDRDLGFQVVPFYWQMVLTKLCKGLTYCIEHEVEARFS